MTMIYVLLKMSVDTSFPLYTEPPAIGSIYYPMVQINDIETRPSPSNNDILSVAGLGRTEVSSISLQMRQTTVSPITNEQCNKMWENLIQYDMMCCTSSPNDLGNDSCQGDSCGPLVSRGGADNGVDDLLVGLVSWGPQFCADPDFPGVYSRTSSNIQWIEDNVCNLSEYSVCENGKMRRRSMINITELMIYWWGWSAGDHSFAPILPFLVCIHEPAAIFSGSKIMFATCLSIQYAKTERCEEGR